MALPAQQRKIGGHAQVLGVKVERIFVERGVSGSKPLRDRAEGAALLAVLQPGDTVTRAMLWRSSRRDGCERCGAFLRDRDRVTSRLASKPR